MAIQNQGFRRDLNLLETEDDRNAIDNLAGAGTNKDLAFLQNNLRNTSSIPFYAVDSDGFLSTANDRVIGISSITATGNTDDSGNKSTNVAVALVNPFLIKFGDLVKVSGITGSGSEILNGSFTVRGTSTDLKTYTFPIDDVDYSETITSVTGIGFSISSADVFTFTKDDVINVDKEVKLVSTAATVFSPNTDYYVSETDGVSKFKLSTTSSTVGFNTVVITGGASLTPDNFIFSRKDAVHQQQIINYIKPEIQDADFFYLLDDASVNSSIDATQSVIESAEYFMAKKYRGDKDINVDDEIKFEGSVVINDPNNYNSTSDKVLGNNPIRRSPGVYIGDTRAFSSDNNPWDKVGTALTTSSEEVSIGELTFLDGTNSMVITGIDNDVSTVSEVATSFTHKIPVKIQDANGNQESYFLLLTQN